MLILTKTIKQNIKSQTDPQRAKIAQRFFKTGPGQYGEGDLFLGLSMPIQRKIAKKFALMTDRYQRVDLKVVAELISSQFHEERMVGLLIMTYQYPKLAVNDQRKMYRFYLDNTDRINNWDLVDATAPKIVGQYLLNFPKERDVLFKLAKSNDLWERRIAVLSTFPLIKQGQFKEILSLSKILLNDQHDLIHKAVGWMLRELGKVEEKTLISFLDNYYLKMPRTMLRYAIERLNETTRLSYLN